MIGKNDYDFFPKDEADFFTSKDREVMQTERLLNITEEPIQTKHKGRRILTASPASTDFSRSQPGVDHAGLQHGGTRRSGSN